jgi:hypothetical protein
MRSQAWLLIRSISHHKVHQRFGRVMEVPDEDLLLQWSNVKLKELQPMSFQADLIHVNVASWNCLVAALKSLVAGTSVTPLPKRFHDVDETVSEVLSGDREHVNVGTGLSGDCLLDQLRPVIFTNETLLPVKLIGEELVEFGAGSFDVEVVSVDEVTVIV